MKWSDVRLHFVGNNTKWYLCNFAQKSISTFWHFPRVPASFCSETFSPSLSETRESTGQSWQKDKMPHLQTKSKLIENALSAAKMPLILYDNEGNTCCPEGDFLWSILWEHLSFHAISSWRKWLETKLVVFCQNAINFWQKAGIALEFHQIGGCHFLSCSVALLKF